MRDLRPILLNRLILFRVPPMHVVFDVVARLAEAVEEDEEVRVVGALDRIDDWVKRLVVGIVRVHAAGAVAAFAADVVQLCVVFFDLLRVGVGRRIVKAGAMFEADRVAGDTFGVELTQAGLFCVFEPFIRVGMAGGRPDLGGVRMAIGANFRADILRPARRLNDGIALRGMIGQ